MSEGQKVTFHEQKGQESKASIQLLFIRIFGVLYLD